MSKIKGIKGYNEKLQCTPGGKVFQYEVGKTYHHDGDAVPCKSGFHFFHKNPLYVLGYYPPIGRFTEVEGEGCVIPNGEDKVTCTTLHVGSELSIQQFVALAIEYAIKSANGNFDKATGYQSISSNTGNQSISSNTGHRSVAVSLGIDARASASIGSWIVLSGWKFIDEMGWQRVDVQSKMVDGVEIKPDTLYRLVDGAFVEVAA